MPEVVREVLVEVPELYLGVVLGELLDSREANDGTKRNVAEVLEELHCNLFQPQIETHKHIARVLAGKLIHEFAERSLHFRDIDLRHATS